MYPFEDVVIYIFKIVFSFLILVFLMILLFKSLFNAYFFLIRHYTSFSFAWSLTSPYSIHECTKIIISPFQNRIDSPNYIELFQFLSSKASDFFQPFFHLIFFSIMMNFLVFMIFIVGTLGSIFDPTMDIGEETLTSNSTKIKNFLSWVYSNCMHITRLLM